MNKGPNQRTMLKYLLFLFALINKTHQSIPFRVDFSKQYQLFREFKIDFKSRSILIEKLEYLGVLVCTSRKYLRSSNQKTGNGRTYEIKVNEYVAALSPFLPFYFSLDESIRNNPYISEINEHVLALSDYNLNGLFSDYNIAAYQKKPTKGRPAKAPNHYISNADIDEISEFVRRLLLDNDRRAKSSGLPIETLLSDCQKYYFALNGDCEDYPRVKPVIDRIRLRDRNSFLKKTSITFRNTDVLSENELEAIRNAYIGKLLDVVYIRSLAEIINSTHTSDFSVKCNIKFNVRQANNRILLSYSGRQYNSLASKKTRDREAINELKDYNGNFDIHSTIYAVVRLLEKGLWDCDWDLKSVLLDNGYQKVDGSVLTKNELKSLMYRTFFTSSPSEGWMRYASACSYDDMSMDSLSKYTWYKGDFVYDRNTNEKRPPLPKIDKNTFMDIYRVSRDECGDIQKYSSSIFLYESILECYVLKEMAYRGYDVRNVYDCFFFRSAQISENDFKSLLTECAFTFRNEMHLYDRFKKNDLWTEEKTRKRRKNKKTD